MFVSVVKHTLNFSSCATLYPSINPSSNSVSNLGFILSPSVKYNYINKTLRLNVSSKKSELSPKHSPNRNPDSKPKANPLNENGKALQNEGKEDTSKIFPTTIPKKPKRGRKSEAAAVEDFMRDSLERTFASIRQQNSEVMKDKEPIMKEKIDDSVESDDIDDDNEGNVGAKNMVIEEENPDWPLDADVGWGIRASDYFEQHPIRNVTGEDGVEIDWEGEIEDNWVKEINCLEWEAFAFHPSPLIVLVFERYNRPTDNWKFLKELEKATKVYWRSKDRLPPRAVKIDINIERDMAYALKVREGPQLLFLRGNRILYREEQFRTADELVQLIAHFYFKAKKPSCMRSSP